MFLQICPPFLVMLDPPFCSRVQCMWPPYPIFGVPTPITSTFLPFSAQLHLCISQGALLHIKITMIALMLAWKGKKRGGESHLIKKNIKVGLFCTAQASE